MCRSETPSFFLLHMHYAQNKLPAGLVFIFWDAKTLYGALMRELETISKR